MILNDFISFWHVQKKNPQIESLDIFRLAILYSEAHRITSARNI